MNYPFNSPFAFTGEFHVQFLPPSTPVWYQGYPMTVPVAFPYQEQHLNIDGLATILDFSRPVQQLQDATAQQHMYHQQQHPPMHGGLHGTPQPLSTPSDSTEPMIYNQNMYPSTTQAPLARFDQPGTEAVILARHAVQRPPSPTFSEVEDNFSMRESDSVLPALNSQNTRKRLSTRSSATQAVESPQHSSNMGNLNKQQSVHNSRHVVKGAWPTVGGLVAQVDDGNMSTVFTTSTGTDHPTETEADAESSFNEHSKAMPQLDGYGQLMQTDEFLETWPLTGVSTFDQELDLGRCPEVDQFLASFEPADDEASGQPDAEFTAAIEMMCADDM